MNKNELVNYLLEHQELSWEISGKVEEVLLKVIDEFFDKYQPERSKREDSIPEWGANAPLNYDEWEKRCGALNSMET